MALVKHSLSLTYLELEEKRGKVNLFPDNETIFKIENYCKKDKI